MKKSHRILALVMALIFVFTYVGCSASSGAAMKNEAAMDYAAGAPMATYAATTAAAMAVKPYGTVTGGLGMADGEAGASIYEPQDDRYVIKNANITVETKEYDASVTTFEQSVAKFGGYVSNSSRGGNAEHYSRYMDVTIRIPAENLDAFLAEQENVGNVTNQNIWIEDVTDQYVDNEARIQSLTTKKDRLLAILEKATKLSDIIELEAALSETIYELERMQGTQNKLTDRINYSTVNLHLYETVDYSDVRATPVTLSERIANRFEDSVEDVVEFFEDLVVFVAGNSPVIVLWIVIAGVVFLFVFRGVKRSERKRMERLETYNRIKAQQEAAKSDEEK